MLADGGWLCFAGVLERCSRCLLGWAMGSAIDMTVPFAAMVMALRQRQTRHCLVHPSDCGEQYASGDYRPCSPTTTSSPR